MTNYDLISSEYYSARHATCRNFDVATKWNLVHHLPFHNLPNQLAVELCAGTGRLLDYTSHTATVHVDSSIGMLSLKEREPGLCVLADACHLPFTESQFGLAAAFLCDPALSQEFVNEVYRVLAPGGTFLFSTPAYEWATALRGGLKHETTFVTETNAQVTVPSNIYTKAQLLEMLCSFRKIKLSPCWLPEGHVPSGAIEKAARTAGISVHSLQIVYLVSCRK